MGMAYIFLQDELPRLLSTVPGRERVFFVSKELTNMDDMLTGIMYYKKGAASHIPEYRYASGQPAGQFKPPGKFGGLFPQLWSHSTGSAPSVSGS